MLMSSDRLILEDKRRKINHANIAFREMKQLKLKLRFKSPTGS